MLPAERGRSRIAAFFVALAAYLVPARALAQAPESFEFRWDAPGECPSERRVRERIQSLAGSARWTETPLQAVARIKRDDAGTLHLELVVRTGTLVGTRSIEAKSCSDLAGATAVALALLLRSEAPLQEEDLAGGDPKSAANDGSGASARSANGGDAAATKGSQPVPTAATSKPPRPPDPAPQEGAPGHPRLRVLIQAPLAAFTLGSLPEPSIGLGAGAGVSLERFRFFVDAALFRTQRLTMSEEPGIGADLGLFTAGPRACVVVFQRGFELAPCLSVSVEHLRARGSGDHIVPRTQESTWLAGGLGVQARVRLAGWFALVFMVSGRVEASRPVIAIDGVGTLGQLGPASLTAVLGPEWIL